jgi:hypothetical protein
MPCILRGWKWENVQLAKNNEIQIYSKWGHANIFAYKFIMKGDNADFLALIYYPYTIKYS